MAGNLPDPAGQERPGLPSWVKWLALAGVVGGVLVVALIVVMGGEHGPGSHAVMTAWSTRMFALA